MLPQVFVTTRELLNSGQGRWQSPAATPGMEIFHSCSCTAFWAKKHKLICFRSREAASPGESVLTSLLFSHRHYPVISRHVVFVSTSTRRASPTQTPKQGFFSLFLLSPLVSSVPFPQLTVTEGTGGINRGERICSLVQMKSKWEEQGVHFLSSYLCSSMRRNAFFNSS